MSFVERFTEIRRKTGNGFNCSLYGWVDVGNFLAFHHLFSKIYPILVKYKYGWVGLLQICARHVSVKGIFRRLLGVERGGSGVAVAVAVVLGVFDSDHIKSKHVYIMTGWILR